MESLATENLAREDPIKLAEETIQILEQGYYINQLGVRIEMQEEENRAIQNTELYNPCYFDDYFINTDSEDTSQIKPHISVSPLSTLEASFDLAVTEGNIDLLILNFASGRRPGGGVFNGANAQEETLARSSGLYPTLAQEKCLAYYHSNKRAKGLYTDHSIYSPHVPVFRSNDGLLLDNPYLASFVSIPAPNAGSFHNQNLINQAIERRIKIILSIAQQHHHRTLLFGAWGCGVFKNDPRFVAQTFRNSLSDDNFRGSFDTVHFAILDNSYDKNIIQSFEEELEA